MDEEKGQLRRWTATGAMFIPMSPVRSTYGGAGKRMIQGGRGMVRKAVYMPVLSAIRYNPAIRDLYQRLIAKGKLHKVALVACMHKMITILNSMAKNNTPWRCTGLAL